MQDAVIVSAARTPIGSFGGGLSSLSAVDLGAVVIEEALKRSGVDPNYVDEVIMGNVLSGGQGMNPARQALIRAGIPVESPGMTINKVCGSGLKAVVLAAQTVRLDEANVIVAGGMESMSRAPYVVPGARYGYRMGNGELVDSMVNDGLYDLTIDCHMGVTAENVAKVYGVSREDADRFAFQSQERAGRAISEDLLTEELTSVSIPQPKGGSLVLERDEHPRADVTLEQLARLKPAFQSGGVVTAGNSSGINDGAAAVVVASERWASKVGIKPMAVVRSYASVGVEPGVMGIAPVQAIRKALKKANLILEDIDLVELNEAFAVQAIAVGKELNLNWDKTNVSGGAIALGHPIGASGARILTTLLYGMRRRNAHLGLASLCIGGGQGIAVIMEQT